MISRDEWQRVEPILDVVLDLPADEVDAHLRRSCSGEPEIHDTVKRLVAIMQQATGDPTFLESPPSTLAAHALSDPESGSSRAADLEPGAAVGPYRVVRALGRGGMGVVHLAHDPRLDRLVALKLLPASVASDESTANRLVEEARAASTLDHPNIETIYDIGATYEGRPYFAMAYYEGETLADLIREGPVPVGTALTLAAQIVEGLRAAHACGIIHRDVKPANVMVTADGIAKILDFGLAGGVGAGRGGPAPGTLAYMSPEQTRGSTDARTDLWSFGVVCYEMLAGHRPFSGADPAAVADAIRSEEPRPLRDVRPDVPKLFAEVVHRCLAKDTDARFATADAVAEALAKCQGEPDEKRGWARVRRHSVPLGLSLLVTALTIFGVSGRDAPIRSAPGTPATAATRMAVFPLADAGTGPEDAYLAGGMTAELTSALSRSSHLSVVTPGAEMPQDHTDASVASAGRRLGVAAVLRGDVTASPRGVELSLQLLDVASLNELWAARYTTQPAAVPAIRADVVANVSKALRVPEAGTEPTVAGTDVDEAYTEYLKGRYFLDRLEPSSTAAARDHFLHALDLDPTFASAWSGLSGAYNQLWVWRVLSPDEAGPRARAAAERALELDPRLAEAYAHLAAVLGWYYRDMAAAERNEQRALALEPSSARVYRHYAVHLRDRGRFDEALAAVRQAAELEPLSPGNYRVEGMILYMARRYEDAIGKYRQLLRVDPRDGPARVYLALAHAQMGRLQEALDELREADPDMRQVEAVAIRGYVLGRLGSEDEARRMLSRLGELSPGPAAEYFSMATVLVGMGEASQALDMLEQAVEARASRVDILKVEPVFDPLRNEPRFQALLEQLGLADP